MKKITSNSKHVVCYWKLYKSIYCIANGYVGRREESGVRQTHKRIFSELKFYNDAMNNQITLRDVMVHRTGLPRHDLSWYLSPSKSRDSLVQRIQYMQPTYGVREKWQYNNFMYLVQGCWLKKSGIKNGKKLYNKKYSIQ
jgi:hypothetical protein